MGGAAVERRIRRAYEVDDDIVAAGVVAVGEQLILLGGGLSQQALADVHVVEGGGLSFSVDACCTRIPPLGYTSRIRSIIVATATLGP